MKEELSKGEDYAGNSNFEQVSLAELALALSEVTTVIGWRESLWSARIRLWFAYDVTARIELSSARVRTQSLTRIVERLRPRNKIEQRDSTRLLWEGVSVVKE